VEHPVNPVPTTTAHAVNLNSFERITAILPIPCLFVIPTVRADPARDQNRVPAAQPPNAPPFVALPPQPKIPHPDNNAARLTATTASRTRRHSNPSTFTFTIAHLCEHKTFSERPRLPRDISSTVWRSNLSRYHSAFAPRICACPNSPSARRRAQPPVWPVSRPGRFVTIVDFLGGPRAAFIGYIQRARCGCILHFSITEVKAWNSCNTGSSRG
jgi:hypothetical protein